MPKTSNNAIVLVDMANRLRAQGKTRYDALIEAGRNRFRPIMMTTLTTVCGLIPMALGSSKVVGMAYAPLGRTMIGGLLAAVVGRTVFNGITVQFSMGAFGLEVGPAGIVIGDGYPDDTAFAGEGEEAGDLGLRDPRETCDLGLPEAVGVIKPGQQPELVV